MRHNLTILAAVLLGACTTSAVSQERTAIIFDTDFALPPQDDGLALMLAVQSPELEILGITTVAGNKSVEQATADVLRFLEIAQRSDIPVYQGADMPLVHDVSEFAVENYGSWYSDEMPEPWGGFAEIEAEAQSAVPYIVETVLARPGEVTIAAIGPLTNIAQAIRAEPSFAAKVKSLMIMGGAIALLPDGAGNITPNAEFNFWVDPEAARVTLRSGIPIELSPLNVSRKSALTRDRFRDMTADGAPFTPLLQATMGPRYEERPDRSWHMYDQIAIAALIDPSLVVTESLFVDVDINHGISYGTSVGGRKIWPGAEGAPRMNVQYDLDWPKFFAMFAERVQRPLRPVN